MAEVVFTTNISGVIKELDNFIKERMADACVVVRQRAIDSMREPKSGRVYDTYFYRDTQGRIRPVGKRGKPHQASAPGEPPAIDIGELVQSITFEISEGGKVGAVGSDKKHGLYMEYGTSKVKPRPWLKPAFENSKDKITEIFTKPME
jgi:HK97 gp10 family phage protein